MPMYEINIKYAGIRFNLIKNKRKPLSELIQSVCETNIQRASNLLASS